MTCTALNAELELIRKKVTLSETEDSWDVIADGLSSLIAICHNGGCDHASDMVSGIRSLSRPLISAMNSERSRLSGTAVDLVSALAVGLGSSFEPLVSLFVPTLLGLCGRTNKVFTSRAKSCILTVIEHTQLPSILHYLADMATQKSALQRLTAAEAVLACLNCLNPPDLEKEARARLVEDFIRVTARDASPDVRKASKQIFGAYKTLMPARVENFVNPLTPTVKKYLDIQSHSSTNRTAPSVKEARPKATAVKQKVPPARTRDPRPGAAQGVSRTTQTLHVPTRQHPVRPSSVTSQRVQCGRPVVNPGPQRPVTKSNARAGCNALSDPLHTGGARRVPLPTTTHAGPSTGSSTTETRKPVRSMRLATSAPKIANTAARTRVVQPSLKPASRGRMQPVPRPLPRSQSPVVLAAAVPLPPSPEPSATVVPPTPVHSPQQNNAATTRTVEERTVSETPAGQLACPCPSPSKTPITALLTSIQRGFLFTPASPLSPPHTYLPVANERARANQQTEDEGWPALNMTRPLRS